MKPIIIATALAALLMATACNDDDKDVFNSPATEAGSGTVTNTLSTVSALEFDWEPVDGVYQYGYWLTTEGSSFSRKGLTSQTHLRFDNLNAATPYSLRVEAYGSNGTPTLCFTLTASTADYVILPAPDASTIRSVVESGQVIISWDAVEMADYYTYKLLNEAGDKIVDGSTRSTELTFKSLAVGEYTFELSSCSNDEGFLDSEAAIYQFVRNRAIVKSWTGTYTSHVLGARSCTVNLYEDGAYEIEAFYGVEGYNLEYTINNGVISILNAYFEEGKYRYIETGLEDNPSIAIYEDTEYCTYAMMPRGKQIKLYVYFGEAMTVGYDTFLWNER